MKQTDFLTVVFDTEYDIHYVRMIARQVYSISRSTRIVQVASPGTHHEHEMNPGDDDGFLWQLNSYWRFEQGSGGVYIQCEAISLSRSVPTGLNWIVVPFIRDIPGSSLSFLLDATRKALLSAARSPQKGSGQKLN